MFSPPAPLIMPVRLTVPKLPLLPVRRRVWPRMMLLEMVDVFGPADAPFSLVRGRRRKRFLIRADRGVDLQAFLAAWRARTKVPGSVRVTIDVDPYSFL